MNVLRYLAVIAIPAFLAQRANANTEFIGALLLDGVQVTENTKVYKDDNDGRWYAADIAFLPGGGFTIFKAPVTLQGLPTAARVSAKQRKMVSALFSPAE
jgi:hypothetical protein